MGREKARTLSSSTVIVLSIGGERFEVLSSTLASSWAKGSLLHALFVEGGSGSVMPAFPKTADGAVHLDRDGKAFRWILGYLRDGPQCALPIGDKSEITLVRKEASYYALHGLVQLLDERVDRLPIARASAGLEINRHVLKHPLQAKGYHGVQLCVLDTSHFELEVRVCGVWGQRNSFLIGLATEKQWANLLDQSYYYCNSSGSSSQASRLAPADIGFFFAPHSGRLLGADGSSGLVPSLTETLARNMVCRTGLGIENLFDANNHLASGHRWGIRFTRQQMEIYHKDENGVCTDLGTANFKRHGKTLPIECGGFRPTIIFKHKARNAPRQARYPMARPKESPKGKGRSRITVLPPSGKGGSKGSNVRRSDPPHLEVANIRDDGEL